MSDYRADMMAKRLRELMKEDKNRLPSRLKRRTAHSNVGTTDYLFKRPIFNRDHIKSQLYKVANEMDYNAQDARLLEELRMNMDSLYYNSNQFDEVQRISEDDFDRRYKKLMQQWAEVPENYLTFRASGLAEERHGEEIEIERPFTYKEFVDHVMKNKDKYDIVSELSAMSQIGPLWKEYKKYYNIEDEEDIRRKREDDTLIKFAMMNNIIRSVPVVLPDGSIDETYEHDISTKNMKKFAKSLKDAGYKFMDDLHHMTAIKHLGKSYKSLLEEVDNPEDIRIDDLSERFKSIPVSPPKSKRKKKLSLYVSPPKTRRSGLFFDSDDESEEEIKFEEPEEEIKFEEPEEEGFRIEKLRKLREKRRKSKKMSPEFKPKKMSFSLKEEMAKKAKAMEEKRGKPKESEEEKEGKPKESKEKKGKPKLSFEEEMMKKIAEKPKFDEEMIKKIREMKKDKPDKRLKEYRKKFKEMKERKEIEGPSHYKKYFGRYNEFKTILKLNNLKPEYKIKNNAKLAKILTNIAQGLIDPTDNAVINTFIEEYSDKYQEGKDKPKKIQKTKGNTSKEIIFSEIEDALKSRRPHLEYDIPEYEEDDEGWGEGLVSRSDEDGIMNYEKILRRDVKEFARVPVETRKARAKIRNRRNKQKKKGTKLEKELQIITSMKKDIKNNV